MSSHATNLHVPSHTTLVSLGRIWLGELGFFTNYRTEVFFVDFFVTQPGLALQFRAFATLWSSG